MYLCIYLVTYFCVISLISSTLRVALCHKNIIFVLFGSSLCYSSRVGPSGQHCGCLIHQLAGLSMIMSHITTHLPSPPLESDAGQVTTCHPHTGGAQSCSQCALTTAHVARRMATPSRDIPFVLESIRGISGKLGCLPRVLPRLVV